MERTPIVSILEALEVKGHVDFFSDGEIIVVPQRRYYSLIMDNQSIVGVVYSSRNGFPSSFTVKSRKFKQYCVGSRPAILV